MKTVWLPIQLNLVHSTTIVESGVGYRTTERNMAHTNFIPQPPYLFENF